MFARVATVFTFLFFVLPMLAAATAVPRTGGGGGGSVPPVSQCNTGTIQCCNSTQSDAGGIVGVLAGLLGIVLGPIEALIGVNCSPITVIGGGGTSCSAQPVCCTGNNFQGLLVLGCSPININL